MELVVFVGLQASGKTTYYRERFAATHAHLSMDLWPNAHRPRERLMRELDAALAGRRDVVVDNTSPTRADREPLVAAGKRAGARVRAVFFETTLADAMSRNEVRTGRARVPYVAIRATAARMEPPTVEEGFAEVERVRLLPRGFATLGS